jgi:hypothetical protein
MKWKKLLEDGSKIVDIAIQLIDCCIEKKE